jgi:hypothetical protein
VFFEHESFENRKTAMRIPDVRNRAILALILFTGYVAATPAATNPCSLLTAGEISAVLPGAKAGKPDASREKYGISACEWSTQNGRFIAQRWQSEGDSAMDEIRTLMMGIVDPMKSSALANVRFETFTGIGEQAVAVVEVKDPKRGIIGEAATLVAKRGDQVLMLIAPELTRRDRAKALAALQSLAQKSIGRL